MRESDNFDINTNEINTNEINTNEKGTNEININEINTGSDAAQDDGYILSEFILDSVNNVFSYSEIIDNKELDKRTDDIRTETTTLFSLNPAKMEDRVFYPLSTAGAKGKSKAPLKGIDLEGNETNIEEVLIDRSKEVEGYVDTSIKADIDEKSAKHRFKVALKNNIQFSRDKKMPEYVKMDPTYFMIANSVFLSFPYNSFATDKIGEDGKRVLETDEDKFEQLMEKYDFLKVLETAQKFYVEKTIPYANIKEPNLTEVNEYKQSYFDYLTKLEEHAKNIQNIDKDDELVKDNGVFAAHSIEFLDTRWKKPLGEKLEKMAATEKKYLKNGWAVGDLGVLHEIESAFESDKVIMNDKTNPKAERDKAKARYKGLESTVKKLSEMKVSSPEQRKKMLEEVKAKYLEYDKGSVIIKNLTTVLERPVSATELGIKSMKVIREEDPEKANIQVNSSDFIDAVKEIYKSIDDVDFFMWGKSSGRFNEMLESLKTLNERAIAFDNDRISDVEDLNNLMGLAEDAMQKIDLYLKRKDRQLKEDVNRKEDDKKQKREQPRIKAAVDAYDKLNKAMKDMENSVVRNYKADAVKKINERLENEETIRKNSKTSNGEYKCSVLRSIDLVQRADDSYYHRMKNESFSEFAKRISTAADVNYSKNKILSLNADPYITKIRKKVCPETKGYINGKEAKLLPRNNDGTRAVVTNASIKDEYKAQVRKETKNSVRQKESAEYRKNLISQKSQKKAAQEKNQIKK